MKMGRAAKATIGDLVYAVLTGNGKLSDGKALFHADHANLSAGAISVDSLDKARQNMRKQKEGERALNIRPAYMLVPVGLETLASQTIKSASVKGADINAGIVNPIQNFAEVIAEPRLDDADPAAWYLAAARAPIPSKWRTSMALMPRTSTSRKVSPLMVSRRKSASMLVWRRWIIAVWRNHPVSNHPDMNRPVRAFFISATWPRPGHTEKLMKNYVQDGHTIDLTNSGSAVIQWHAGCRG
jgi:hypothetical protein